MKTKERILKNWITSILGVAFMGLAVYALVINIKVLTFPAIGLVAALSALGYVFLMAKDSLIEGIFLGVFKVDRLKSAGDPPDPPIGG